MLAFKLVDAPAVQKLLGRSVRPHLHPPLPRSPRPSTRPTAQMSSIAAGKRPARDDDDDGSDSDSQWVAVPAPRKKKARTGGSSQAVASSDDEADGFVVVNKPVAVDDAVAAVAAVAQQALANTQPRLTAAQKRAKFLAKYSGKTPEEILGMLSIAMGD